MKHIYAFESLEEAKEYEPVINELKTKLEAYETYLKENFKLIDPPKGIAWTTGELATKTFSENPIPAYTNKDVIFMSPDKHDWRNVYFEMMIEVTDDDIEDYFNREAENLMITVAGHEMTHHIDLFFEDFDGNYIDGIWFEEGMCDYISRKYFLSDDEFKKLYEIEVRLIEYYLDQFGDESIETFGLATYGGSMHYIMFQYWRSFAIVTHLVEEKYGSIDVVFKHYEAWYDNGQKGTLAAHFDIADMYMY